MAGGEVPPGPADPAPVPHVTGLLDRDGLIEPKAPCDDAPTDLTRTPLELPADRALRLQALPRADEGLTLPPACSTQRGYARTHAFAGELRIGRVPVGVELPELGAAVEIGEVKTTECGTVNQFKGPKSKPPQFARGHGLVMGPCECKAISMSLADRALRWAELGGDFTGAPAQDREFALSRCDNVQATGFLDQAAPLR